MQMMKYMIILGLSGALLGAASLTLEAQAEAD